MLPELLDVFRKIAVEIVGSNIDTSEKVGNYLMEASAIVKDGIGSAGPSEIFLVAALFAIVLYLMYKFFWNSAKDTLFFIAILAVLAVFIILTIVFI